MREPPHTHMTCFCVCHQSPDVLVKDQRWAPRNDPIGAITACTQCRYLHSPTPITRVEEEDAA